MRAACWVILSWINSRPLFWGRFPSERAYEEHHSHHDRAGTPHTTDDPHRQVPAGVLTVGGGLVYEVPSINGVVTLLNAGCGVGEEHSTTGDLVHLTPVEREECEDRSTDQEKECQSTHDDHVISEREGLLFDNVII
jgi:hypothetical protein